ncbi:hypothetical protein OsJ_16794 [Oryza sativa Japonica Group]|uniref:Uncharacterized protein n=1 Tax=Oryza sativa subsp. japonica TaxID=39947 RepID=B9FK11_ORYSJ|nr:hypothetical protein OsJ_16794 [Oryza sativa Japonica Group]
MAMEEGEGHRRAGCRRWREGMAEARFPPKAYLCDSCLRPCTLHPTTIPAFALVPPHSYAARDPALTELRVQFPHL